jgi:hypothetical protein
MYTTTKATKKHHNRSEKQLTDHKRLPMPPILMLRVISMVNPRKENQYTLYPQFHPSMVFCLGMWKIDPKVFIAYTETTSFQVLGTLEMNIKNVKIPILRWQYTL